jgi:hypothetical protein
MNSIKQVLVNFAVMPAIKKLFRGHFTTMKCCKCGDKTSLDPAAPGSTQCSTCTHVSNKFVLSRTTSFLSNLESRRYPQISRRSCSLKKTILIRHSGSAVPAPSRRRRSLPDQEEGTILSTSRVSNLTKIGSKTSTSKGVDGCELNYGEPNREVVERLPLNERGLEAPSVVARGISVALITHRQRDGNPWLDFTLVPVPRTHTCPKR